MGMNSQWFIPSTEVGWVRLFLLRVITIQQEVFGIMTKSLVS